MIVEFTLNGEPVRVSVAGLRTLLDLLRDELGLTGTKKGCEIGECGTCTVLLDGEPVNACMVLANEMTGRELQTVEGLAGGGRPHPVQAAFGEHSAAQCGICTPGMIMSAVALLQRHPAPDAAAVRAALAGNLCRCTGYAPIIAAVLAASGRTAVPEPGEDVP